VSREGLSDLLTHVVPGCWPHTARTARSPDRVRRAALMTSRRSCVPGLEETERATQPHAPAHGAGPRGLPTAGRL